MLSDVIAILRKIASALVASNAPGQLAAGFTIGMMIGLLPKGNLIALSLCVVLFSIRCNKGLGFVAAIAFSFAGPWTNLFAHRLGLAVLSLKPLQATYASVFNLPFGPWLGFNNTVVIGSLLIGAYAAYPVYWISKQIFTAARRPPREARI
ncbi:MAG TPA: TIGR03546 family protein [Lacipirellulaceae bacterium]|nr:TIGR03546 family protein [Lacipirellulaceae bacterium]